MDFTVQGDFCAPIYNHSDLMSFTDVSLSTYRSWRKDGSITAGTATGNGRMAYSIADMLNIKLITRLAITNRLPISQAVSAADMAADWFAENYNKSTDSRACLVVYSDGEPQIANDSADLESILNERSGAVVVRLSAFLKSAISPNMSKAA